MADTKYNLIAGRGLNPVVNDGTTEFNYDLLDLIPFLKGGDIASATALVLGTDGNYFDVTGTTTITSITTVAAGTMARLHFDGIVTLTHNGASLILPGAANIATAAGDEFTFIEFSAGNWRCVAYALASGEAVIPTTIIDKTSTEAFLVRKDGDGGDILIVNTTNSRIEAVGGDQSAAGPAYTFVGDTNTGMYHDDPNILGFSANGQSGMTINGSSGSAVNLLDGQTFVDVTNAAAFTVRKNAAGGDIFVVNTTNGTAQVLGQLILAKGADIASAAALAPGTDGNYFDVTGAVTITSINTLGIGTTIRLHFDAALTLTHNATDLILPGGANITTAAGDEFTFVEYAANDWRCVAYALASGKAIVESVSSVDLTSWASVDMTGTATINESVNVSGIVDEGVGDFTLSWTTDYANGTYATSVTSDDDSRSSGGHTVASGIQDEANKIGASCRYRTAANDVLLDSDEITVITIGTSS